MRAITYRFSPHGGDFGEGGRLFAEHDIAREAVHDLRTLSDGTVMMQLEVSSEPARVRRLFEGDWPGVLEVDVTGADDNAILQLRFRPRGVLGELIDLHQEYAVVVDYPIEFVDPPAPTVRVVEVGRVEELRRLIEEVRERGCVTIEEVGSYEPFSNRLFCGLTDRQQQVLRTAIERGYTAVKLKGRPWWDVWEQIDLLCSELPEWFSISIDFNATLLDADRAIPILTELDEYPQVQGFEGPIPYDDVEGDRRIRDAVDANVALHYGSPPVTRQICEEPCDEFVFYGAPPEQTMRQLHVASEADIPGFLQYPGTGLSAAFALHYGAVGETVTKPAISCYELYEHSLLEGGFIDVEDGHAEVPDDPGLGFELDRDAVEEFAIERPTERPNPPVLTEWYFPEDGKRVYLTSNSQTGHAKDAEVPFYQRGARARRVPDDGSDAWQDLYDTATENEPYVVEEDPLA